jgi:hypothetical protein
MTAPASCANAMVMLAFLGPSNRSQNERHCNSSSLDRFPSITFLADNTVLIGWDQADPMVRLQVREEAGDVVLQQRIMLSQLQTSKCKR